MILFWIIYILGVVATMLLLYCSLERGYKITLGEITFAFLMSIFSWLVFVITLIVLFGDNVVFIKK